MKEVLIKIIAIILIVFVILTSYNFIKQNETNDFVNEAKDQPFTVSIIPDKTSGVVPFEVKLSSLVLNNKGDVKYKWDFGNGNTSNEQEQSVLYDKEGEYTCSLKVTDEKGNTNNDSIDIIAKKNKPPVVVLSINEQNINREFNWLELLTLTPIAGYAGNQQLFLDSVEKQKGADAWGKGRLVVTAQVSDPEDDEIVSYDWKVQTADSLITSPFLGSKELLPIKSLKGEKNVTVPELYAWMANAHIVTLTVTDSAGNNATAYTQFIVSESLKLTKIKGFKAQIKTTLPFLGMLWGLRFIEEPVTVFLDGIWLILPQSLQNIILSVLRFIGWDYDPPIPKADLEVSAISDIDLSAFVNDITGEVETEGSVSKSLTITNNDSKYIAENIYISLKNPVTGDEGLHDAIEKDGLIVSIEGIGGAISNKLFYNGNYTKWENCFVIEKLSPGDSYTFDLNVLLKEGSVFNPGIYENCTLYIYQAKSFDYAEYIDEVPFKIIL